MNVFLTISKGYHKITSNPLKNRSTNRANTKVLLSI